MESQIPAELILGAIRVEEDRRYKNISAKPDCNKVLKRFKIAMKRLLNILLLFFLLLISLVLILEKPENADGSYYISAEPVFEIKF